MVAQSHPEHDRSRSRRRRRSRHHTRAAWLVLASDGPAIEVADQAPGLHVRVVADPARFRVLLLAERPRIVVCAEPPADPELLRLVAAERRRRAGMRAVHLAPPDAVDARLAALAAGFDDALTTAMPAPELVGRLSWLDAKARTEARYRDPPPRRRRARAGRRRSRAPARVRRGPPASQGVRPARAAGGPPGPRLQPPGAAGPGLGTGPQWRHADGRRPRALAPLEDRAGAEPTPSTSSRSAVSATGWIPRRVNRPLTPRTRPVDDRVRT